MKINGLNQNCNSINFKQPSFTAIPVAIHEIVHVIDKGSQVDRIVKKAIILKLERRDLWFVKKIVKNYKKYCDNEIFKEMIKDVSNLLQKTKYSKSKALLAEKTDIFVSVVDKNIQGMIVGNMPKFPLEGKLVYSSNYNLKEAETELDWLITEGFCKNGKIKNVGKGLMASLFRFMEKKGFENVFVRSDINENTQKFYQVKGKFQQIREAELLDNPKNNFEIFKGNYASPENEFIIPYAVSRQDMVFAKNKLNEELKMIEIISGKSSSITKFVKFKK